MPKVTKTAAETTSMLHAQQLIKMRLEEMGISIHQFSNEQEIAHPRTVQAFLYSGREPSAVLAFELLKKVGLTIVPEDRLCQSCKRIARVKK